MVNFNTNESKALLLLPNLTKLPSFTRKINGVKMFYDEGLKERARLTSIVSTRVHVF